MTRTFADSLVDATLPDDLPEQIIVVDHQNEARPYYLRIIEGPMEVGHVELEDANGFAVSLVAAVMCATREGYAPTHYIDGTSGPWPIPTGIPRRPASTPPRRAS
jgi:hypothetical protein